MGIVQVLIYVPAQYNGSAEDSNPSSVGSTPNSGRHQFFGVLKPILKKGLKMTNREKTFMLMAREVSKLSTYFKARIGAVLVDGNHVVSSGYNKRKTHPLQKELNKVRGFQCKDSIHAETDCISWLIGKKDVDFTRMKLFVYREDKRGNPAICRPCPACQKLIRSLGIKEVYYLDELGHPTKESKNW